MSPVMRALGREDTVRAEPVPIRTGLLGAVQEQLHLLPRVGQPGVAILLSTYNGESLLAAQLHSFLAQTHHAWTLYWRDDGSTDGSVRLVLRDFAAQAGEERCLFPPAAAAGRSPAASSRCCVSPAREPRHILHSPTKTTSGCRRSWRAGPWRWKQCRRVSPRCTARSASW